MGLKVIVLRKNVVKKNLLVKPWKGAFYRHAMKQLLTVSFFFSYLMQVFRLEHCNKLTEIPPNISLCKRLEKVQLKDSPITTLPEDLFEIPDLMVLELVNLPVKVLPDRTPETSWLTKLVLSGLQLTAVPPSVGNLTELVELNLENNLLTDLPMEFQKLQRLRILNLCGKCVAFKRLLNKRVWIICFYVFLSFCHQQNMFFHEMSG